MGGRGSASGLNAGKSQKTYWAEGVWSWSPARSGSAFKTLPLGLQDNFMSGLQSTFFVARDSGSAYAKPGANIGFTRINARKQGDAIVFELKEGRKTLAKSSDAQAIAEAMAEAYLRNRKK